MMTFKKGNVVRKTNSKSKAELLLAQGYSFVSGAAGESAGENMPEEIADRDGDTPTAENDVGGDESLSPNEDSQTESPPPNEDSQDGNLPANGDSKTESPPTDKASGKGAKQINKV